MFYCSSNKRSLNEKEFRDSGVRSNERYETANMHALYDEQIVLNILLNREYVCFFMDLGMTSCDSIVLKEHLDSFSMKCSRIYISNKMRGNIASYMVDPEGSYNLVTGPCILCHTNSLESFVRFLAFGLFSNSLSFVLFTGIKVRSYLYRTSYLDRIDLFERISYDFIKKSDFFFIA